MNSTAPEVSTNSTTPAVYQVGNLEICMFCINLVFGLPTHTYVIWLIANGTRNGVALSFFNLNLSVCEIGTCLECLFLVLSNWISNFSEIALFLQGPVIAGRPLFQCLICVERYLAVVHPVTFLKYKPLRYRVICCIAVWIFTIASCLVCMITLMLYNINARAWFFLLQLLLFLFIQLFCLVTVLRALKQTGPGERRRDREESHMKRRAFFIILITTVNMVVVYVPFSISGLLTVLTKEYVSAFWLPGLICYVLAGFVQPVLYLHQNGKLSCLCSP